MNMLPSNNQRKAGLLGLLSDESSLTSLSGLLELETSMSTKLQRHLGPLDQPLIMSLSSADAGSFNMGKSSLENLTAELAREMGGDMSALAALHAQQKLHNAAMEAAHNAGSPHPGLPPGTPQQHQAPAPYNPNAMEGFPMAKVNDFKKVLYNLLVESHNNPGKSNLVTPWNVTQHGNTKHGFKFNPAQDPDKRLAELYAQHIRKGRLDTCDQNSVFIQDLYKFYLRACVELLSKYFEKIDRHTYAYDDIPLFIPGGSMADAETRIKAMKTRARRNKKGGKGGKASTTKRRRKGSDSDDDDD